MMTMMLRSASRRQRAAASSSSSKLFFSLVKKSSSFFTTGLRGDVYYDDDEKSVNTYYPMMMRKENNINNNNDDARRRRRHERFSSSSASTSSSSPNTNNKVDDILKQFLSLTAEEKRDVFQSLFGKGKEERKILVEKEQKLFAAFDSDGDKVLTPQEFQNFHRAFLWRHLQQEPEVGNDDDGEERSSGSSGSSKEITYAQLKSVALSQMYPFIGFGFLDNALMLAFGETIESSVGLSLGLSTMAAAAIGNTLSDVCGVGLANKIEYWCAKFGLTEEVTMTTGQAKEMRVVVARLGGAMTGVTTGCIVGSFPLLLH
jgi:hypothetical protein